MQIAMAASTTIRMYWLLQSENKNITMKSDNYSNDLEDERSLGALSAQNLPNELTARREAISGF